ncbi:MGDG synthase family glycosyltransferase [Candidatus Chloroploca asiatica]|uniref:Galactosyldiacylglycerol synthase n=1 Tax=Candidatus Chloroploca asiatica TaxID=1506545 RepID=A0A2H3LD40_9CHLR|nr:glycosyltransferase [Candidatus Chloroploca asiatica]PDW00447.1 hypothetical protein A9Q02_09650 [Candidatus Chloroploca asiatica]
MPTRVLILSASVGSGHKAAAAAIEQAFQRYPEFEVINQDALLHTSRIYQVAATDAYFALVKENPWSVGWLYDYNDEPFKNERGLSRVLNMLNGQPLVKLIEDYHPNIIICTHFMPAGIAAQLLLEERINSRLGIVTTDYDFQGMWLSRSFNHYFVALDEARALLASFGVDDERITVSGIPVTSLLSEPFDCNGVYERYNLQADLPVLLVSAGALGGGPALEIVEQIMGMKTPVQTIVVCGRNQPLRQAVTTMTAAKAEHFRVLGFTNEMPDLMRAATLFVGKPGGLSTAECMAAGLPMVVIDPIPGQEERNSDHLLENGAAIRCRDLPVLGFKIDQVLQEPGRLEGLRAGTQRLARPDAARVVIETLLNDTTSPYVFDREQRRRIIAVSRGKTEPELVVPPPPDTVILYDDETGVLLGTITPTQMKFLDTYLVEEHSDDETYYLDEPTLDYLIEQHPDPELLTVLRSILRTRTHVEIRFVLP